MKPTLVIAEDIETIRDGLTRDLQGDFDIVASVANGAQAVEACREFQPRLALLDIVMPQLSGIEATRQILSQVAQPPGIVIYSGMTDDSVIFQAMEAGAHDYVVKPAPIDRIKEVLRAIAQNAA